MVTQNQEQLLSELREKIRSYMSPKRFKHTCGVEREITALSAVYAPEDEYTLRVAALLHDITKKLSHDEQLELCDQFDIPYTEEEKLMPKTFHSRTAAVIIRRDFSSFADDAVLLAIRFHTTGRADMTIGEKLLYLADYIEDTRTFEDCVELRKYFYTGLDKANDANAREALLYDTLILSFDMTIRGLIDDHTPIHTDTVAARNSLICCCHERFASGGR